MYGDNLIGSRLEKDIHFLITLPDRVCLLLFLHPAIRLIPQTLLKPHCSFAQKPNQCLTQYSTHSIYLVDLCYVS